MNILRWELLSAEETLARFGKTRLKGCGQPYVYATARLTLEQGVDPSSLIPAQRYVLREDLDNILSLHRQFSEKGLDIFALTGVLLFWIENQDGSEEGPIPLAPPLVELSQEADGQVIRLINDGMHRVSAARQLGKPINIILADGVSPETPYYALPLAQGWDEVEILEELPDSYVKKAYRWPDNYKALFRDFNEVFPGIQKQRKQTGPVS